MTDTINFLIKDEIEAIKGYEEAIEKMTDEKAKAVLIHIRDEEVEHIKQLTELQKGE